MLEDYQRCFRDPREALAWKEETSDDRCPLGESSAHLASTSIHPFWLRCYGAPYHKLWQAVTLEGTAAQEPEFTTFMIYLGIGRDNSFCADLEVQIAADPNVLHVKCDQGQTKVRSDLEELALLALWGSLPLRYQQARRLVLERTVVQDGQRSVEDGILHVVLCKVPDFFRRFIQKGERVLRGNWRFCRFCNGREVRRVDKDTYPSLKRCSPGSRIITYQRRRRPRLRTWAHCKPCERSH